MSDLTLKGGNKRSRKPLKNLSESQANRTMSSTPPRHARAYRRPAAGVEEDAQVRHREPHQVALYSPPRIFHGGGANRRRLYTEFNGSERHRFGLDESPYAFRQVGERHSIERGSPAAAARASSQGYPRLSGHFGFDPAAFRQEGGRHNVVHRGSASAARALSLGDRSASGHFVFDPAVNPRSPYYQDERRGFRLEREGYEIDGARVPEAAVRREKREWVEKSRPSEHAMLCLDHRGFVPAKNPRASFPEREWRSLQHERKRLKTAVGSVPMEASKPRQQDLFGVHRERKRFKIIDDSADLEAREPRDEFPHGLQRNRKRTKTADGNAALEAPEPNHEEPRTAPSPTDDRPRLLWLPEDKQHLTDLHCFVRKHCVYIFCATSKDVGTPRKGRKKALNLGQIGIGCLHCKETESKLKGSTYFPTSISGIYNATMIIQQRHFPVCPSVSMPIFCEYNKLKSLTARSACTKEYWVSAARKLGLVDTPKGVFFRSSERTDASEGIQELEEPPKHLVRLVEPSDKMFATEYAYFVMNQMTTCFFTEADRLGKRKCHSVGFPGLACRHCFGGNGSGRFFPLTLKTFSDVSKSIHVLRNHLVKCTKAPGGMAKTVNMLYERHKEEKQVTPFGSQKIFFDNVWKRLHPELCHGDKVADGTAKKSASAKPHLTAKAPRNPVGPSQHLSRDAGSQNMPRGHRSLPPPNEFDTPGRTNDPESLPEAGSPLPPLPSPPIIHRGRSNSRASSRGDERSNRELCMIPKKRYLYSQRSESLDYRCPDLPPLYPTPLTEEETNLYTESDVSVAMILARGFERKENDAADEKSPDKQEHEEV